ncbi:MAG: NADH-quinone oxidoreductase subunit J [Candidatus Binatia bacterium]
MNPVVFGVFAVLLIASALGVVLQRSPIRSALSLVMTLFLLAVVFLFLHAQLVAALQVIVYAGAIMVLFLFVIMLLNLQADVQALARVGTRFAAVLVGSLFLLAVLRFFVTPPPPTAATGMSAAVPAAFGSTALLAEHLFTRYLLAFEITSVLLLVAVIGAVVLAKRKLA